uniref:Putative secreted protein n=1 Tax=Amblyomma cajennense TaxID=34607 RepID=A0A023FDZ0_AMBCJ
MQTALFFFLLVTVAYVQCRPSEQSIDEATNSEAAVQTEEKDFCTEIGETDRLLFLGCLAGLVPEADAVLKENGGDVRSLLDKICGPDGAVHHMKMIEALEMSDDAINECSELIQ